MNDMRYLLPLSTDKRQLERDARALSSAVHKVVLAVCALGPFIGVAGCQTVAPAGFSPPCYDSPNELMTAALKAKNNRDFVTLLGCVVEEARPRCDRVFYHLRALEREAREPGGEPISTRAGQVLYTIEMAVWGWLGLPQERVDPSIIRYEEAARGRLVPTDEAATFSVQLERVDGSWRVVPTGAHGSDVAYLVALIDYGRAQVAAEDK